MYLVCQLLSFQTFNILFGIVTILANKILESNFEACSKKYKKNYLNIYDDLQCAFFK